jgi:hypothetical protein
MPTILNIGPYRFFFYGNDRREPMHVHVERDDQKAKFWIRPVVLAHNRSFRAPELSKLHALVREHEATFEEAWHAHFDS